jgi:putative membrane protein
MQSVVWTSAVAALFSVAAASSAGEKNAQGSEAQAKLTDAQILEVANTANTGEVTQGTVAETRASSDAVKSFAKHMVTDHGASKRQGESVAKQLGVTPAPSPVANTLKKDADKVTTELHKADSAAFDKVYMRAQVNEHQKVLRIIDQELMPQANAEQVKALLGDMKAHVQQHLSEAESTLQQLSK